MSYRGRKIKRDYTQPFFNRRRNYGLWVIRIVFLLLILAVPAVLFWQQDAIEYTILEVMGNAPTATPFASTRADLGEEFYVRGDVESAALNFEIAVTQQPDNVDYLYEYGLLLLEQDRNDEASVLADRILELDPDDLRGYALKANSIVWQDPAAAIPFALQGVDVELETEQQFAPIHGALSVGYTLLGRYDEAIAQGDLAVRIDPMDPSVRRSYSYPLIFTGNVTEAVRQLEQAIAINPNLPSPYFELASLYRSQSINQPEMAVAVYQRVLELDPDNERAYLRLCETYAAVGLFQDAEFFCDDALTIDEYYASAHRMRGQLRYSRRNYEGAIESFQTCLDLEVDPSGQTIGYDFDDVDDLGNIEIECLYLRGWANYLLDNCDEAWRLLDISLQHPEAEGQTLDRILIGLENITIRCAGYQARQLPTPIPPTPIPPTPIGGF